VSVCLSNTRTADLPVSQRQATFAKSDTNTKWAKKRGHRLMTIILSNLIFYRFQKFFHWKILLINLQLNGH